MSELLRPFLATVAAASLAFGPLTNYDAAAKKVKKKTTTTIKRRPTTAVPRESTSIPATTAAPTTTEAPPTTVKELADGDTKANPTAEDMTKACWYKEKYSDEKYTALVNAKYFPPFHNVGEMLPNCAVNVATWWLDETFMQIAPCASKEYYQIIAKNEKIGGFHALNPSIMGPANKQTQLFSVSAQTYANARFEGIVDRNFNLQGQLGNTYTAFREATQNPTIPTSQVPQEACKKRGTVYYVDQNSFSQSK